MVTIFFNFWRKASLFFVVAVFMFCYTTLPDSIAYSHDTQGQPMAFIDKQSFFYIVGGILLFFNLLMGLTKDAILKIDFAKLHPKSIWANAKVQLTELVKGWFNAFVALVNSVLVFVFLGLNGINRTNEQILDRDYNWLIILLAILLMGLIFFLPLRILYSNPSKLRND